MRVAIVAQGQSWRGYKDCDPHEVWAINSMGLRIGHDLLFAMDDLRVQEARAAAGNESIRTLLELLRDAEFYTSTPYPEYRRAKSFPLERVTRSVGRLYFNSTVAYAIGYAIDRGVTELHVYGADFTYPDAHKAEKGRACVEYLIGIAESVGIEVSVPRETTLLDSCAPPDERVYGYDAHRVMWDGWNMSWADKPLPTAAEIERRYG